MAKKPDMNTLQGNVNNAMNRMYSSIYFADPQTARSLSYMRTKVHRGIDKLVSSNMSYSGLSNVSKLLDKTNLANAQSDKQMIQGISDTLENESLMDSLMQSYTRNSWLRDFDNEVDMVLKYMPKLEEALDTRREHVLSADHFSKNSINIINNSATGKTVSSLTKIKDMAEKYDLQDLQERVYKEMDKKGEAFIYICPYKKALQKLLVDKKTFNLTNPPSLNESGESTLNGDISFESFSVSVTGSNAKDCQIVTEDVEYTTEGVDYIGGPNTFKQGFTVELVTNGVLESVVRNYGKANNFLNETASLSFIGSICEDAKVRQGVKEKNLDIHDSINKNKENFYATDGLAQDGVKIASSSTTTDNEKIKVPGCIVKMLDHTMVKPLYSDDVCLGYFYIECDRKYDLDQTTFSNTLGGVRNGGSYRNVSKNAMFQDTEENMILKKVAQQISQKIDSKFINANQDLSREIYMILKYNTTVNAMGRVSRMRVTFIPPEDMVHAYFDLDLETHRGISSLRKALFPAKLFSCLYISNTLNILTRGNDKRVYYVKQQVDTNISGVLLNTLNQIQRSNFNLRQIESMSNVLGMLGKFNDLLIPRSPSGEAPLDVEVVPGQNVEVKTELMQMLEEMAVNSTDVPLEVIQAQNSTDFATHLTMTNTKFLQKIYNRQAKTERVFNKIVTKIYDAEFECNDSIVVKLPPPMYLNVINSGQIFQQATDVAGQIADIYGGSDLANNQEALDRFARKIKKNYIVSFVNEEQIEQFKNEALMEASKNTSGNTEEQ